MASVLIDSNNKVIMYGDAAVLKPEFIPFILYTPYSGRNVINSFSYDSTSSGVITATITFTMSMSTTTSQNSMINLSLPQGYIFSTAVTGTYTINGVAGANYTIAGRAGSSYCELYFNNAAKELGDVIVGIFTFTGGKQ